MPSTSQYPRVHVPKSMLQPAIFGGVDRWKIELGATGSSTPDSSKQGFCYPHLHSYFMLALFRVKFKNTSFYCMSYGCSTFHTFHIQNIYYFLLIRFSDTTLPRIVLYEGRQETRHVVQPGRVIPDTATQYHIATR